MRFDRLLLMVMIAVLPVLFWTGSTSYDALKFLALGLVAFVWLLALAGRIWRRHREPLLSVPWLAAGGFVLLIILASQSQAVARPLVWRTAWLFGLAWLVALMSVATATTAPDLRRLVAVAIAGVTATCLYGLTQMAGWVPGADPASGFPAGISTLGNQNFLAGLAAAALWPSLALWSGRWKWYGRTATLILSGTVVAAGAAGPLIAALTAGAVLAVGLILTHRSRQARVPAVTGALILALALLAGWFVSAAMDHDPAAPTASLSYRQQLFRGNSGEVRRTDWLVAAAMFEASPLTGIGAGNYPVRWPEFRALLEQENPGLGLADHTRLAARAHNEYLQAAAELGLAGLVVLAAILLLGVRAWTARWRRIGDPQLAATFLMLTAGLVTVAVHALVSFPLHLPATGIFIALVTGLLGSPVFAPGAAAVPGRSIPRLLAPVILVMALVVGVGSVREFRADHLIARGRDSFVAGRIEEAAGPLTRGVEACWWPGQGPLYLGLTRQALGQSGTALAQLRTSLRSRPAFEGMLALAEIHIEAGNHDRADSLVSVVLACRPFDTFRFQARYLKGLSKLRQGDQHGARRMFVKLLADDPENFRSRLALGFLAALGGDREEARTHYRQALNLTERKLQVLGRITTAEAAGKHARLARQRDTARKALASLDP